VRRREFITLLGGAAAAWPLAARAQQPAMPVIGLLDTRFPDAMADRLRGFRRGLAETGYVEGDNVMILYRWAENNMDRVPELVADLVRRQVAVMQAGGNTAAIVTSATTLILGLNHAAPHATADAAAQSPAATTNAPRIAFCDQEGPAIAPRYLTAAIASGAAVLSIDREQKKSSGILRKCVRC